MQSEIQIKIDTSLPSDYEKLIMCKQLPKYDIIDNIVYTDQESYNYIFGEKEVYKFNIRNRLAFDYQKKIAQNALERKCFAAFLDCGLGKTFITLLWHQQILKNKGKTLLLCPLAVVQEFIGDAKKFGFNIPITELSKNGFQWTKGIGILNYESRKEIDMRGVTGISVDESSILKNADGATKKWLVTLSKSIEYRLCTSATPAPNEQAEYATHAVFLGIARTEKEFYSRFFRKDGNKWRLKAHAVNGFYKYMQSFSCYIHDPSKLGFERGGFLDHEPEYIPVICKGGAELITDTLFSNDAGFKQMKAIERYRCLKDTERFNKCVELAESSKSIVWCSRNDEEANFANTIKNSALITGKTSPEERVRIINEWRDSKINTLISKPKILGWGVNLQQAESMIYSGYDQSMEKFYQAVRRSHRYGRDGVLKVYIPMIPAERPVFDLILEKLNTFNEDVVKLQENFSNQT